MNAEPLEPRVYSLEFECAARIGAERRVLVEHPLQPPHLVCDHQAAATCATDSEWSVAKGAWHPRRRDPGILP